VDRPDGGYQKVLAVGAPGGKARRVSLDRLVARARIGRFDYNIRLTLGHNTLLRHLYLRTWFQHNAMAASHLMPGTNQIRVEVANEEALQLAPLTLVYRYRDAPDWKDPIRTLERRVTHSGETFTVTLPQTERLPQMQDLTLRFGQLAWKPPRLSRRARMLTDFTQRDAHRTWQADAPLQLRQDEQGLLIVCPRKATYPQISLDGLQEDWTDYEAVVIELENLGSKAQKIVFRVRSNNTNTERTDVHFLVHPGAAVLRVPVRALRKTRLDAITKIYLMTYEVPDTGCQIRVQRIVLEPPRSDL